MTMTTQQALLAAADLIEAKGWTQKTYARDAHGKIVDPTSPDATCFCLYGAVRNVLNLPDYSQHSFAMDAVIAKLRKHTDGYPATWNDRTCTSKEEAAALLRKAAA